MLVKACWFGGLRCAFVLLVLIWWYVGLVFDELGGFGGGFLLLVVVWCFRVLVRIAFDGWV